MFTGSLMGPGKMTLQPWGLLGPLDPAEDVTATIVEDHHFDVTREGGRQPSIRIIKEGQLPSD
jgi:hypothetical protein